MTCRLTLEKELNGLRIESFKLRVNLSRFNSGRERMGEEGKLREAGVKGLAPEKVVKTVEGGSIVRTNSQRSGWQETL